MKPVCSGFWFFGTHLAHSFRNCFETSSGNRDRNICRKLLLSSHDRQATVLYTALPHQLHLVIINVRRPPTVLLNIGLLKTYEKLTEPNPCSRRTAEIRKLIIKVRGFSLD
ncbi:hypothetical protein AVEN_75654-1 [Araneus ventricosus]|uniref:Uncharacterized protein n=1 Tax=Araneus ventricosus TaxID=182803 RepID=A0A4Y2D4U3_ARAVE|nr:hypothetical protein AVEN_75654-1 [Araneus ventricosus]